jgi:hypothetical protein
MSGVFFLFIALGSLAGFIVWEMWQRHQAAARPLDRRSIERGFVPGASQRESALLVMALVLAAFGFVLLLESRHLPFTGRGAAIDTFLYEWLGPWGAPGLCWLLSLSACAMAMRLRRKRLGRQHDG